MHFLNATLFFWLFNVLLQIMFQWLLFKTFEFVETTFTIWWKIFIDSSLILITDLLKRLQVIIHSIKRLENLCAKWWCRNRNEIMCNIWWVFSNFFVYTSSLSTETKASLFIMHNLCTTTCLIISKIRKSKLQKWKLNDLFFCKQLFKRQLSSCQNIIQKRKATKTFCTMWQLF